MRTQKCTYLLGACTFQPRNSQAPARESSPHGADLEDAAPIVARPAA
jgi:hypothetical protein